MYQCWVLCTEGKKWLCLREQLKNDCDPFMKQGILCPCTIQHWKALLKQLPSTFQSAFENWISIGTSLSHNKAWCMDSWTSSIQHSTRTGNRGVAAVQSQHCDSHTAFRPTLISLLSTRNVSIRAQAFMGWHYLGRFHTFPLYDTNSPCASYASN